LAEAKSQKKKNAEKKKIQLLVTIRYLTDWGEWVNKKAWKNREN
jgi:hypothetical protein